jgi:hypothetical protein
LKRLVRLTPEVSCGATRARPGPGYARRSARELQ